MPKPEAGAGELSWLFPTPFWEGRVEDEALLVDLEASVRMLAVDDGAGRRWSRAHGYQGYTSYASLDDLPRRDPAFGLLVRHLDRAVAAFGEAAHFDLGGRRLKLDSLWVNLLKRNGGHSGHIHPQARVSGTLYVVVPEGSGALKLEDPKLPMLMAAPSRRADQPEEMRPFVYRQPAAGRLFLWESWLRHEVMPASAGMKGERISISFNYA